MLHTVVPAAGMALTGRGLGRQPEKQANVRLPGFIRQEAIIVLARFVDREISGQVTATWNACSHLSERS